MMKLEEAINHCETTALSCAKSNRECALEYVQLMQWLKELRVLRQLVEPEYLQEVYGLQKTWGKEWEEHFNRALCYDVTGPFRDRWKKKKYIREGGICQFWDNWAENGTIDYQKLGWAIFHPESIEQKGTNTSIINSQTFTKAMKKVYFGGQFRFMYKDASEELIAEDFRARVLGDYRLMLKRPQCGNVQISNNVQYIGPFYFYEQKDADSIVKTESDAVSESTDCVFVLSNASAPGTVAEIIHATMLKKDVYIFYEVNSPDGTVESSVNSDLWYPLTFALINNSQNTHLYPSDSYEDAVTACIEFVNQNYR